MVGYTEALTDPSYNGQLLTLTYPLVGNYGVPDPSINDEDGISKFFESNKIQVRGLVVHELSLTASHWNLSMTLDEWMYNEKIPGISGIDTRALTMKLRNSGVMMAALVVSDSEINVEDVKKQLASATHYDSEQFMDVVSTEHEKIYGDQEQCVVVVDTGAKNAIIRNIREIGYRVILVPWNTCGAYQSGVLGVDLAESDEFQEVAKEIPLVKKLIENNIPTLGICLGAQIIGIAGNTETYKLKYGHRGQNKPCVNLENNQVYVTSQNHGYGITPESLEKSDFNLWFTNADDHTVCNNCRYKSKLLCSPISSRSNSYFKSKFIFEELKNLMELKKIA